MRVLVDTCVWSLALRRRPTSLSGRALEFRTALEELLRDDRVILIGPIRQELLSGVRDPAQFEKLRLRLTVFRDEPIVTEDYEEAARIFNKCRSAGVTGSGVDMLMCAIALRLRLLVFTQDDDFKAYARTLPLSFFHPSG